MLKFKFKLYNSDTPIFCCLLGNHTVSLNDLLQFITASRDIPPTGFAKEIRILFYDNELGIPRRPWVSTWDVSINLPRGMEELTDFQQLWDESILCSPGFGKI